MKKAARPAASSPRPARITPAEAAALLNVTEDELQRMVDAGQAPRPVRVNKKTVHFRLAGIEACLKARLRGEAYSTGEVPQVPTFQPSDRFGLLLTATQLAELLMIDRRHLDRLVAGRKLPAPFYLSPACPRWRRKDVEDWINAQPAKAR
jgi:predicted DNA-binding transcriptional regulator AlpA